MLHPQARELSYYKWPDSAPIRLFLITGGQRGTCADITVEKIRNEVSLIRGLVPQLRNMSDPELVNWLPDPSTKLPLLLGLEMESEDFKQTLQQYSKRNNPRAQFQVFDRSSHLTGFGEGIGIEGNRTVAAYSWTTTRGGITKYSDELCRNSNWYNLNLITLLGGQGINANASSQWLLSMPEKKRADMWTLMHRLFLKALYACPGSPAKRECVLDRLNGLVATDPLFLSGN